ncbi:MAG: hypothetical protein KGL39_37575 [Patescibacteria group bacterium]|nr:hypothetical protein [Patescibacteria group bacterium]
MHYERTTAAVLHARPGRLPGLPRTIGLDGARVSPVRFSPVGHAMSGDANGRAICGVAMGMNDELTIILSAIHIALADMSADDPLLPVLCDAGAAAQRLAWTSSGLLVLPTHGPGWMDK